MARKTVQALMACLTAAVLATSAQPAQAIVGGTTVQDPTKYPWMVQVQGIQGSSVSNCGGTIINSKYVVTAAHCIVKGANARMVIRVGGVDRKRILNDPRSDPRIHTVRRSIIQNGYSQKEGMVWNDIALIEINGSFTFSPAVQAIKLPQSTNIRRDYGTFTTLGWGKLSNNSPEPGMLHEVNVPQSQNCYRFHNFSERDHLCGLVKNSKGTCDGDSGGPAAKKINGTWYLIGIPSGGAGTCAKNGEDDYYTRVSTYINWISSYTHGRP
ncbi:S1 family peptidase [Streptomyces sp. NPDC006692]|uniref:S1 family peptidase n=1 Tax=unclassified Streptomyces TaxID=2593676 RepID=UPI0036B78B44